MAKQYGPWATMIDLGGSPQLSTFWRRRLTMLASASQTSFSLSRRNVLWLGAAALLLMALPTVHFAAAGEDGKTGESTMHRQPRKSREHNLRKRKSRLRKSPKSNSYSGSIVMFGSATVSGNDFYLPVLAYGTELRRHPQGTWAHRQPGEATAQRFSCLFGVANAGRQGNAKGNGIAFARKANGGTPRARGEVVQQRRLIRREVERLLTAQQLKRTQSNRHRTQRRRAAAVRPAIGRGNQLQRTTKGRVIARVLRDDAAKTAERRLNEALKKNREKTLAVIAPEAVGPDRGNVAENDFPVSEPGTVGVVGPRRR